MSMNLHASCAGKPIELYQTPTYITRMILVSSNGPVACLKGKQARRALHSYFAWLLYPKSQVFGSDKEYEEFKNMLEVRKNHVKEVQKFLESPDLEVYEL